MAKHLKGTSSGPYDSSSPARHAAGSSQTQINGYVPQSAASYSRQAYSGQGGSAFQKEPKRHHYIAMVVVLVIVAVVAFGGVVGFSLYRSAQTVRSDANVVLSSVDGMKDAMKSGDTDQLAALASDINVSAHNIDNEVSGPAWSIASVVPVYGQDVSTLRELSSILVDLSDNAISPMVANSDALNLKNLFSDRVVNVDAVSALSSAFQDADPAIRRSVDAINALPDAHIPQMQEALSKVKDKVGGVDGKLSKLEAIVPYLPQMLGAGGQTRTYLVVAQNNAEMRASGGYPGSVGTLSITDGRISLGDFASMNHASGLSLPATDEEKATFGGGIDTRSDAATLTPNFPRVGTLMQAAWSQIHDVDVAGVVGVDPVFLQSLLALTGPVTTSDGTELNGDNAASELENNVYWRYGNNNTAEDAFFAEAAGAAFSSVMGNLKNASVTDLYKAVLSAGEQRHLQVWMQDEGEEGAISTLGISGALGSDPAKPELGVFNNDITWAKIAWYLDMRTSIGPAVKNADGSTTYDVTTTMTNTITPDQVSRAPRYITGDNPLKRSTGDMVAVPQLYAPAGGKITDVSTDSDGQPLHETSCYDFDLWTGQVNLSPQETRTITYKVTTSPEATEDLTVTGTALGQTFA